MVTGAAVEDPSNATNELIHKKMRPMAPGYKVAVSAVLRFHCLPPKSLYTRAAANPAKDPMNTYSMSKVVSNPPRFDGEVRPSNAHTMVQMVIAVVVVGEGRKMRSEGGDERSGKKREWSGMTRAII